jgi:anti-sigma factor RsiW
MTCADVREQVSLLLDDALTVAERQALETHLAGCGECRRELEQLRETVGLLRHLPPVHAPAGFIDRVMAEASRPPWPRRVLDALFRPLRVKLPLEAAAVLLVGVSALYVYQRTPEVQEVARHGPRELSPAPSAPPASPPAPPSSADVAGEAARASTVAPESGRGPVTRGAAREEAGQAPAVSPPAPFGPTASSGRIQESPAAKPEAPSEARPEVRKEAQVERRPDTGTESAPPPPGEVTQSAEPSPARDAAGARSAAPPAPGETAAPSAATPAPSTDARGRAGGVAGVPSSPPAPEGAVRDTLATPKSRVAARLTRAVDASGRLTVPAREPAEAALDALLGELGATRVARRVEGPQALVLIDVVVPVGRYRELIEGLGRIGRWVTDYEAPTLPAQVRVELGLTAEP